MKKRIFYSKVTNKSEQFKRTGFSLKVLFVMMIAAVLNSAVPTLGQSVITVFSENFDNATSTQPWSPYFSSGWFSKEPLNTLQNVSGKGKVLQVNFPANTVGSEAGIGNYRIPLDSAYKELYLSWEYFLPANFDFGWADKLGGGKFFCGFAGGSMTAIPNTDATDVDGWVSILMFQDGYSTTYNYFKGSSFSSGGWPYGERVATIVKGQWRRMTIRLKINDGDLSNGLFEVYDNDVLVHQLANAKIVNGSHPEYLIEHIYLNSFFGGSGREYVSPITQFMEFDNLIAFYFPKGSTGYRSGPSESGRIIQVPKAASYHPLPPNRFRPTTYTDANGTINSHCSFYQPVNHTDNFETSTIQVSGATSLNINVTKFNYDGGVNYIGYKQILKIYQGTGSNRVLKQTYQNGILTTPGSIAISGNSATIEWQAGQGSQNGFSLNYSSNGTGSGKNFTCADYKARQGSTVSQTTSTPLAPINLTHSDLTDRSLTLKWTDNSNNEGGFEIECAGPNSTTIIQKTQAGTNATSIAVSGLIGNSTYILKIRAYNTTGYSPYSNSIQVRTNYALPNAPSGLVSTAQTANSITLKWADNSGIEDGFKIERSLTATTGYADITTVLANVTVYTDNSLNAATTYYYRIRAYNPAGNSTCTDIASATTSGNPLNSGLIANYTYENSVNDMSGNGHNGTCVNGATFSTSVKEGNYSMKLDGINDYANIGALNLGTQFTFATWVFIPSGYTNIRTLVANTGSGATNGYKIFINTYGTTDRKIILETVNGSQFAQAVTPAGSFTFDKWNHVAVVANLTTGKALIYLNGINITSVSSMLTNYSTNSTTWLGMMTNTICPMPGNLDDTRFYNRMLSANEISGLVNMPNLKSTASEYSKESLSASTGNVPLVFPNPFTDYIRIQSKLKIKSLQVYTLSGIKAFEQNNINSYDFTMDKLDIVSTVYIAKIILENNELHIVKILHQE